MLLRVESRDLVGCQQFCFSLPSLSSSEARNGGGRGIESGRGERKEKLRRELWLRFFQMSAGLGSKKSTPVLPQPCLSPMYTTPWPRLQVAIETRPSGGD